MCSLLDVSFLSVVKLWLHVLMCGYHKPQKHTLKSKYRQVYFSQTPAVTRMQPKKTECVVLWLTVTYYTYVFRPDTSSMQALLNTMVWIHQSTTASIMFVLATNWNQNYWDVRNLRSASTTPHPRRRNIGSNNIRAIKERCNTTPGK